MQNQTGTANVWAGISVDPETGLAFLPTSSPSPNYYGGDRLKEMPYVTATVAVNAETGEVKWARQLVHHDIWDVDINSAPTLVDIKKDGQTIPGADPGDQDGLPVRAEPQHRRAGLSDRGAALSGLRRPG